MIQPQQKRPAVFFDRDGVLNVDHGYTYRQEDFEWMPGAIETIKYFNEAGYLVFVVTNQSGVARGFYSEADVEKLHRFMQAELGRHGAHIDAFYYCPHHAEGKLEQYRKDCPCRKPLPGMILQAFAKWPVDRERSFLIGDKQSDMLAAEAAKMAGYRFPGGDLLDFVKQEIYPHDLQVNQLTPC
jgi:D-glycero-D-manno-heptose 1,7-bisphosphate phosphatase